MNGRSIFLKYWNYYSTEKYSINHLPGSTPEVFGSCIGGSNIGINSFINPEKQMASAEVIKYMTSKETQRDLVMAQNMISGITSLYDEEDVCQIKDCELIKSIQYTNRPIHVNDDYDSYASFFRNNIFEFLYGNKTASQVLHNISDYTKIYTISLNTDETYYGLIFTIILIILIFCMCFSLVFLYIKSFDMYFSFLPKDFWFISVFGNILILCSGFLELGKITEVKCLVKWSIYSLGFTFNLIPVLYKLIENFPEENKYSKWIKSNRYIFLGYLFLLI